MDLRNIQSASNAGGGLQTDRESGRLAQERNETSIIEQSQTPFSAPQDQIDFSQDALRGTAAAAFVQSAQNSEGPDGRNSRSAADKNAVLSGVDAGAVTSGGAKQTEREPPPPGLSLDKLSGDLIYEYADINGAHSSITSPLQSLDASRNGINAKNTVGDTEAAELNAAPESKNALDALRPETLDDGLQLSTDTDAALGKTAPDSSTVASQTALPGTLLDVRS